MEKDYHLSSSKTDEAEHLESATPQLQLHQNNTDNEAYKSYHGEGKVKEVANVRAASSRFRGLEVSRFRGRGDRDRLNPRDDL
jgi:hypothetical protein